MKNEEIIWNFLIDKIKNPYGVAAVMGNLCAESSLNPISATGVKKYGLTNKEYTDITDQRLNDNFVHDGVAYGLVQWCFYTRKKGLYDMAGAQNKSVGDLDLQLNYMWQEIQKYKVVMKAITEATNIRDASDVVMLRYERPAGTGEAAKQKRAAHGQRYFDKYANMEKTNVSFNNEAANELYEKLKEILN
jgi:hypothetical protein